MENCIFCKIINEKIAKEDIIFEDDKVLVMLDRDWAVNGHTLVIWKEHFENASELPIKDFLYFSEIFHKTEKSLLSVINVNKSIVLKSGGLVPHFHFHIYPMKRETDWQTIKDIFDKKTSYKPNPGEKEELINSLREHF